MHVESLALKYYRVADAVSQAPQDRGALDTVASGTELASFQAELKDWARHGWRQTGETEVVEVVVQRLDLELADDEVPTAEVDVCYDVAATDVVDTDGATQVAAGRADRGWERLTITNAMFDENPVDGWRVADRETLEQEPCTGQ
ncbi:hypothetical protein GCM10009751_37170 [Myceligenerans crystallogenes]|uniref:Tim44-like domain-containing protein n=2 Tax=Myceligenerans crystallogenes TaxID=316335 RepID=A0ABP4ZYU2_9MICO